MRFMMFMYPEISEEEWNPSAEDVAEMGRYNEELRKAGMLLSLDGLHPPGEGARVSFDAEGGSSCHRRAVRGGEGGRRRLLADPGALQGGGNRVGLALPRQGLHGRGPARLRAGGLLAGRAGSGRGSLTA